MKTGPMWCYLEYILILEWIQKKHKSHFENWKRLVVFLLLPGLFHFRLIQQLQNLKEMTKWQFWYNWNFEKLWFYFHRFCGFRLTGEFSLNIYYNKDFLGIVLKYLAEVRIGTVQWFLGRSMLASCPDLYFWWI